jgi:hypothetical protein
MCVRVTVSWTAAWCLELCACPRWQFVQNTVCSLRHILQELHSNSEFKLYNKLKKMLELPSVDILDESDELLKHKFQLVYAWGAQCPLPSLHQRIRMVQHVLQVLCQDREVRAVLSKSFQHQQKSSDHAMETEAMSLTPHPERLGSLPSIRLISGARMLQK